MRIKSLLTGQPQEAQEASTNPSGITDVTRGCAHSLGGQHAGSSTVFGFFYFLPTLPQVGDMMLNLDCQHDWI